MSFTDTVVASQLLSTPSSLAEVVAKISESPMSRAQQQAGVMFFTLQRVDCFSTPTVGDVANAAHRELLAVSSSMPDNGAKLRVLGESCCDIQCDGPYLKPHSLFPGFVKKGGERLLASSCFACWVHPYFWRLRNGLSLWCLWSPSSSLIADTLAHYISDYQLVLAAHMTVRIYAEFDGNPLRHDAEIIAGSCVEVAREPMGSRGIEERAIERAVEASGHLPALEDLFSEEQRFDYIVRHGTLPKRRALTRRMYVERALGRIRHRKNRCLPFNPVPLKGRGIMRYTLEPVSLWLWRHHCNGAVTQSPGPWYYNTHGTLFHVREGFYGGARVPHKRWGELPGRHGPQLYLYNCPVDDNVFTSSLEPVKDWLSAERTRLGCRSLGTLDPLLYVPGLLFVWRGELCHIKDFHEGGRQTLPVLPYMVDPLR